MPTQMQDLPLADEWVNIYTESGITAGSAILIQNKSSAPVFMVIDAISPAVGTEEGWIIDTLQSVDIEAGDNVIWVKGDGPINIQVVV